MVRKVFSSRLDEETIKASKQLAVGTDKSIERLLKEAIEELVKRNQKKAPDVAKGDVWGFSFRQLP
jgi:predicted transcriptional regulator